MALNEIALIGKDFYAQPIFAIWDAKLDQLANFSRWVHNDTIGNRYCFFVFPFFYFVLQKVSRQISKENLCAEYLARINKD